MIDGTALALIGGAIALYVYDAGLMLFRDEVLFVHGRRGWEGTLGSGFVLGGRYVALPGVFAPGRPVFRACWSEGAPRSKAHAPMRTVLQALRPLRWASRVLFVLLFVGMPVGLSLKASNEWMLALVAALYGIALLCVAWAWRCRRVFGLDRKGLAALAFDVIACPPFAVNVVAKITLRLGLPQAPEVFARRMLRAEDWAGLERDAKARMDPGGTTEESNQ